MAALPFGYLLSDADVVMLACCPYSPTTAAYRVIEPSRRVAAQEEGKTVRFRQFPCPPAGYPSFPPKELVLLRYWSLPRPPAAGRHSATGDAEDPWPTARTSSSGRADERGHHTSTAATHATAVSTRARRLTSAFGTPRYHSYSIAVNRRPPSPIYSSRCSILLLDFFLLPNAIEAPMAGRALTCSMKCIWHLMVDEATYYLYF
jgi:hypothetical protein